MTAWSRGERALLAIRKSVVRALTDFFFNYYIGKIKSTLGEWQGKVKHCVSRAISLIS